MTTITHKVDEHVSNEEELEINRLLTAGLLQDDREVRRLLRRRAVRRLIRRGVLRYSPHSELPDESGYCTVVDAELEGQAVVVTARGRTHYPWSDWH